MDEVPKKTVNGEPYDPTRTDHIQAEIDRNLPGVRRAEWAKLGEGAKWIAVLVIISVLGMAASGSGGAAGDVVLSLIGVIVLPIMAFGLYVLLFKN